MEVDSEKFCDDIPIILRESVCNDLHKIIDVYRSSIEKSPFFAKGFQHGHENWETSCIQDIPEKLRTTRDLYLPNVSILYFLSTLHSNYEERKSEVIVDYACGIPVSMYYMWCMGYIAYGYDNWSSVPKQSADDFLAARGILDKNWFRGLYEMNDVTILTVAGLWIRDAQLLKIPSIKYLVMEHRYIKRIKEDLSENGYYLTEKLPCVHVYERK